MKCSLCGEKTERSLVASVRIHSYCTGQGQSRGIDVCATCRKRILRKHNDLAEVAQGLILGSFKDMVA